MKKLVLFFMISILSGSMYATNTFIHWRYIDEPVKITVRGVDFFIFPYGDFDFNAHQTHNHHYHFRGEYGIRIEKDRYGKIRRIGNVFINYNRESQVSRIGNIFIKYNHHGLVRRIGNLYTIRYAGNRYFIKRTFHRNFNPIFWDDYFFNMPPPAYSHNNDTCLENDLDFDYNYNYDNMEDNYYFKGKNKQKRKAKIKNRRK